MKYLYDIKFGITIVVFITQKQLMTKRTTIKKDVALKDNKEVEPRKKKLKRKQVSVKSSKGSDSNAPSAPQKPKKAKSTPQQNSNLRTA